MKKYAVLLLFYTPRSSVPKQKCWYIIITIIITSRMRLFNATAVKTMAFKRFSFINTIWRCRFSRVHRLKYLRNFRIPSFGHTRVQICEF